MLTLKLENIGKKYNDRWLFRGIDIELSPGESLSITGRNGSGKSSLMQIIYGLVQASEGKVLINGQPESPNHRYMAMTAPYMELPSEFSIAEIHQLYTEMGKSDKSLDAFSDFAMFSKKELDKPVKYFSSGMQQRLKTALCLASKADILLLDEPLTNMDKVGEEWYRNCLIALKDKICIVAGNLNIEHDWTNRNLNISNE